MPTAGGPAREPAGRRLRTALGRIPAITGRGVALAATAGLLYLAANQTQVAWLYVFTALIGGAWLTAWFAPGAMLAGLRLRRRVSGRAEGDDLELHAGQPITVEIELTNARRLPALQLRGEEVCPFAPRADRRQPFYAPSVPGRSSAVIRYEVTGARRGWFEFPPVVLATRAPFGLASARRALAAPSGVLLFPEYRELKHLPLFDQRPSVESLVARPGAGGEFIGVREYRPGDPPRHVHWRTTARAGRLIVREFADETQPGLTIALDLRAASAVGDDDDNSLEQAIRVAASLARYADRRGLPVEFVANSRRWPAPAGPLSWWAMMNYLARVAADEAAPFADCLRGARPGGFVAAIFPAPDYAAVEALVDLRRRGAGVMAIVIDPAAFHPGRTDEFDQAGAIRAHLRSHGIDVRVVTAGPEWQRPLEE